jgi:hypothetical protein
MEGLGFWTVDDGFPRPIEETNRVSSFRGFLLKLRRRKTMLGSAVSVVILLN